MRFISGMLVFAGLIFGQTAAFEVASVKPAQPMDYSKARPGMHVDGARLDVRDLPLCILITIAWEIDRCRLSCPDSMEYISFDIAATLPAGATKAQVPAMLRTLLTERFKLKFHNESRPFSVYALVVGKNGPKLRAAAPGAVSDPHALKSSLNANDVWHMEFSNISMADLARVISGSADRPVVDETGLGGVWQASLDIPVLKIVVGAGGEPQGTAADVGSSSLFASVQRLGLKLEQRKEPLEVLVIDHAEKTPMEN